MDVNTQKYQRSYLANCITVVLMMIENETRQIRNATGEIISGNGRSAQTVRVPGGHKSLEPSKTLAKKQSILATRHLM